MHKMIALALAQIFLLPLAHIDSAISSEWESALTYLKHCYRQTGEKIGFAYTPKSFGAIIQHECVGAEALFQAAFPPSMTRAERDLASSTAVADARRQAVIDFARARSGLERDLVGCGALDAYDCAMRE